MQLICVVAVTWEHQLRCLLVDGAIADAKLTVQVLDPNSIGSISFLKDAAFCSHLTAHVQHYGVVLVKTKGGKEGEVKSQL